MEGEANIDAHSAPHPKVDKESEKSMEEVVGQSMDQDVDHGSDTLCSPKHSILEPPIVPSPHWIMHLGWWLVMVLWWLQIQGVRMKKLSF